MSAIAGIICLKPKAKVSDREVDKMLEYMRPDLPYQFETYSSTNMSCRIGRISYGADSLDKLDRTKLHEDIQIFCTGEIYNDDIISYDTMTEYLLNRYITLGESKFADGLNGSFSAVILDERDNKLLLITDHTNSLAIYTTIIDDKVYFASEVKGLLSLEGLPREPDPAGIITLITTGSFHWPTTLVNNVKKIDYATICCIKSGIIKSYSYWRYNIISEPDRGYKYYLTNMIDILKQSVRRRTRTGKMVSTLTGGHDTRALLAYMTDPQAIQPLTFSCFSRESRPKMGDWEIAERIAKKLNLNLLTFYADQNDFANALQESVYSVDAAAGFVFENVWKDIKQTTGADYIIFGDQAMLPLVMPLFGNKPIANFENALFISPLKKMNLLQNCMVRSKLCSFIGQSEKEIERVLKTNSQDMISSYYEIYFRIRMSDSLIQKRSVINRQGLFVRNPFLDFDYMDFVSSLPVQYKKDKMLFNKALHIVNPNLMQFPIAKKGEFIINHQPFLASAEKKNQTVSELIFDNNDLFEDYFDIAEVKNLILLVSESKVESANGNRIDPLSFLSFEMKSLVKNLIRCFYTPGRKYTDSQILLKIMTSAVALRHLKNPQREQIC